MSRLPVLVSAVLVVAVLVAVAGLAVVALADEEGEEGEYGYEEEGYEVYEEEENDVAEALGGAAFYGGLLLNLGFLAVRWGRFFAPVPAWLQRLALELHMDGNLALAVPALLHGYSLRGRAGPVEYAAVALIAVLVASGLVMRYYRGRRVRLVARMVHTQRVLALLLLVLLVVHVASRD